MTIMKTIFFPIKMIEKMIFKLINVQSVRRITMYIIIKISFHIFYHQSRNFKKNYYYPYNMLNFICKNCVNYLWTSSRMGSKFISDSGRPFCISCAGDNGCLTLEKNNPKVIFLIYLRKNYTIIISNENEIRIIT